MTTSTLKPERRISAQALVWALLVVVGSVTLIFNFPELKTALRTLSGGRPAYLPVLLLVQLIFVANMGLFYSSAFNAAGVKAGWPRFTLVAAAGYFINLVSKSSGFGALALYMKEGEKTGDSAAKVTAAFVAAYVLNYSAYIAVLLLSLVLLYVEGSLTTAEVVTSAVLLVVLACVAAGLIAGFRSQRTLERILAVVLAPLNWVAVRVIQRPILKAERIAESAEEFLDASHLMAKRPARYFFPFLSALAVEFIGAATLYFVATALHTPISFTTSIAGYALSTLSSILSITPAGLGFVEASLAVFLVSNGLSHSEALAVTLGYRFFEFWLPVAIGALSALYLRISRSEAPA